MSEQHVIYEKCGPVAKLWLNRPEKNNLVTRRMLDQLQDALHDAENDLDIRVIVMEGKGDAFTSGYDHSDNEAIIAADGEVVPHELRRLDNYKDFDYYFQFFNCKKPIIAGLKGVVSGPGIWFMLMADVLVAAEDVEIHNLEYAFGLNYSEPFPFQYWKLPQNIAMEFALTGYPISVKQAHQWGMINHVVPKDEVDNACMKLASRMCRLNPYSLSMQHEIGTFVQELKGFKHIRPVAREAMNTSITFTSNPGSDAYWATAREKGREALPALFWQLVEDLKKQDDWDLGDVD